LEETVNWLFEEVKVTYYGKRRRTWW